MRQIGKAFKGRKLNRESRGGSYIWKEGGKATDYSRDIIQERREITLGDRGRLYEEWRTRESEDATLA